MHHYGSKDRLRDAVDRRAIAFFEEMIGELARIEEEGGSASLAELFAGRLESEPAMTAYVRRLLADGGEAADALFGKLFEATSAGMRSLVAAGIARATGADPLSRDGLARWTAAVLHRRRLHGACGAGKACI